MRNRFLRIIKKIIFPYFFKLHVVYMIYITLNMNRKQKVTFVCTLALFSMYNEKRALKKSKK